eukprot:2399805-Pyramimonas_sp.AAC.1
MSEASGSMAPFRRPRDLGAQKTSGCGSSWVERHGEGMVVNTYLSGGETWLLSDRAAEHSTHEYF